MTDQTTVATRKPADVEPESVAALLGDGGGHVGIIARNLDGDQTNLTLGELVDAALRHAEEDHGENYGLGGSE